MLQHLFIALLQAVAGDPAAVPADAPADQAPAAVVDSTTTPEQPAAAEAAPPAETRRRCYRVPETGSNRYQRVCVTEALTDAEQDARTRETVRRSTERGGTRNVLAPSGVGGPGE